MVNKLYFYDSALSGFPVEIDDDVQKPSFKENVTKGRSQHGKEMGKRILELLTTLEKCQTPRGITINLDIKPVSGFQNIPLS